MNYNKLLLAKKMSNELQHAILGGKYQIAINKQLLAKKMLMELQKAIVSKKDVKL